MQKTASDFGGKIDIKYYRYINVMIVLALWYVILSNLDKLRFDNSIRDIDPVESTNASTYPNMNNPAINDVTRVNNFVQQVS